MKTCWRYCCLAKEGSLAEMGNATSDDIGLFYSGFNLDRFPEEGKIFGESSSANNI